MAFTALAQAAERNGVVADPDSFDVRRIYLDWSGEDAGLDGSADRLVPPIGGTRSGTPVNEFNRASMVAAERQRLEALLSERRGIGTLVTNIGGTLSDYDPGYGEFYVDAFAPGSRFSFPMHADQHAERALPGLHVTLELENALDAYVWQVASDQAAKLIATLEDEGNASRRVIARTTVRLTGAEKDAGMNRRLIGRITSYTLRTPEGTVLRELTLEP
tara:strand:- start:10894 stop:11547 length:654 start_codon:yes stop_codon:yes gene_type:complete